MASSDHKFNTDNTKFSNDPKFMFLKFVNQKEKVTYIKVLRNSTITKAFEKYYQCNNLQFGALRFLYNGNRIHPTCTQAPADLGIQDGDQIDVLGEVHGGGLLLHSSFT